jgi:CheY-like chemotaxis protein
LGRARILVADDHEEVRNTIVRLLKRQFVVVGAVADGPAFLEAVDRLKPDLCVLDISMPNMSGIEVAHRIKQSDSRIRIVFLSLHDDRSGHWRRGIRNEGKNGRRPVVCNQRGSGWSPVLSFYMSCLGQTSLRTVCAEASAATPQEERSTDTCLRDEWAETCDGDARPIRTTQVGRSKRDARILTFTETNR